MTLTDTLDESLAWRLRLTADALAAAVTLDALATGFTLVAAAATALASHHPVGLPVLALLVCVILLGLVAKWHALRVRFDAMVFATLVDAVPKSGFHTGHLDRALRGVGMLHPDKEGRDWDSRCHGALRLMRRLGWITAAQGLLFVLAAGTIALH